MYDKNNYKEIRKIRVLFILPGLNICGGMESFIMNYYRVMDKKVFEFDFLVHNIGEKSYVNEIESMGGNIIKMPPFGVKTINEIKKLYQEILTNKKYDIVHCNMANAAFIYLKYAKKYDVPVRILHSHQDKAADTFTHAVRNLPLIQAGKRYANCNVACSVQAGQYLFGKNKYHIIQNCIDYDRYRFSEEIRKQKRHDLGLEGKVVIGNTGRLCPQKNQMFLLNVFNKYLELNRNAILLLIGEGDDEFHLREKAKQLGISDKVVFTGARDDIDELLQAMDVFVFPSLYEGLGISALEAQASGLHCLCSLGVPESARITKLFKRINLNKGEDAWCNEIVNAIDNKVNRKEIVINNDYDVKKCSHELSELYLGGVENNFQTTDQ